MTDLGTSQLAALAGAAGAVVVLTAARRETLLVGFALLAGAEAGLLAALATPSRVVSPAFAAAGVVGLAVIGGIAALLARRPTLVTPLVLAAAPFRLPIDFRRGHRFLVGAAQAGQLGRLLPLYVVLAATALLLVAQTVRGREVRPLPRLVAWPAGAFLAFAALSLLWTQDLHAATNLLAYFLLPFAVLMAVVARAPVSSSLARTLAAIAVALGLLFAVIGLVQAATGTLLFYAPSLEVQNSYSTYFRVTSLFRDPSLYGRHVVLAIMVVIVAVWLRRVPVALGAAAVAVLWAGLYFSYSQSSFVALFAAVVFTAALLGGRRLRVAVATATAVVAVLGLAAAAVTSASLNRVTSDRSRRVQLTARVYREHPLVGVGLGAQPLATQQAATVKGPVPLFVSHTTPLTIAAELGTLGLALYAAILVAAARLVALVRRRDLAVGTALGATLVALFVHSLFYSGFFEDPVTWFALGLGAAFLVTRRPAVE